MNDLRDCYKSIAKKIFNIPFFNYSIMCFNHFITSTVWDGVPFNLRQLYLSIRITCKIKKRPKGKCFFNESHPLVDRT
jgi:hypothetical protein